MKKLFYLIISAFFLQINIPAQWYWQNPLPAGNRLTDILFIDSLHAIAVGHRGTIVLTFDGGETWKESVTDFSDNLYGVWFSDEYNGTAVGANAVIRTTDGGLNWTMKHHGYDILNFYSVYFSNSDTGYAATADGLLRSTDGGVNWNTYVTNVLLHDIFFIDESNGFAVGHNTILKTTDRGITWSNYPVSGFLSSVCFSDLNNGTAVGSGGLILRTINGGISWQQQVTGFSGKLESVSFSDENHGSITGDLVTGNGIILRTTDGGTIWNSISLNADIDAVSFYNNNTGIIVGSYGIILKSINGGENWEVKGTSVTSQGLWGIYLADAGTGIIVGNQGTILKTTDGGNNWLPVNSGTTNNLREISFVDNNNGMCVGYGGTILKTTDAGNSWTPLNSGIIQELYDIRFLTPTKAVAVGKWGNILRTTNGGLSWIINNTGGEFYWALEFVDSLNGYACGYEVVIKTTDGGISWTPLTVYNMGLWFDIAFWDLNYGVVVGEWGEIRITTDGGSTWTKVINPSDEGWMRCVFLTGPGKGIAVGTHGSIITTTDWGNTWTDQPIITNEEYENVYFSDANNGVIVGSRGTILKTNTGGGVPVELSYINAIINNNNAELRWATATEINNKGFEVQRKKDNNDWSVIGFVDGVGTTTEKQSYKFTDKNVSPGIYSYRLKQIDFDGAFEYSKIVELLINDTPSEFSLSQNYPNPFNPATIIKFTVPSHRSINIKVFDILGKEVKTLVNGEYEPGTYSVEFNVEGISSGMYFYRMTSESFSMVKKMQVIK